MKLPRREEVVVEVGLETAQLLFAHLDSGAAADQHAARAREIYDRIRRMAVQTAESTVMARARADTLVAFSPGESGVSPKVR